jgi:hypothetical protein
MTMDGGEKKNKNYTRFAGDIRNARDARNRPFDLYTHIYTIYKYVCVCMCVDGMGSEIIFTLVLTFNVREKIKK